MPFSIITHGPTGSGKTGLVNKTINHYGLSETYKTFLIDDLIEQNPHYKTAIDDLIHSECKANTLCETLKSKLLDPTEEMYEKFGTLYMKYRGKTGDKWCDGKQKTCDSLLDDMLDQAITDKVNIVFETVGTYYVSWLVDKLAAYDVYFAFTVLDFCENVRRNKTRAVEQLGSYITDRTNPAPRLPNVEESQFKMTVENVAKTLWDLMGRKLFGILPGVHHIIVFDNTSRLITVLYDSDTVSNMSELVSKIQSIMDTQRIRRCVMRTH